MGLPSENATHSVSLYLIIQSLIERRLQVDQQQVIGVGL